MYKVINGKTVEMTAEEIAELKAWEEAEKKRRESEPPTDSELVAILTGETA